MIRLINLFVVLVACSAQERQLIPPEPEACAGRVRHAETFRNGHYYFFSFTHGPTTEHERDWLDARNICRKHCQDLVSLETEDEMEFIKDAISRHNVPYIWTSGRKCNFDGCDRQDLQPILVNGWFFSGSDFRIPATNGRAGISRFWSNSGGGGSPQPDNREGRDGNDEACLAVLNNFYQDGIVWHDIACNHLKPWVCEDSDSLLAFARSEYPQFNIP